jgi:hypothetical protein
MQENDPGGKKRRGMENVHRRERTSKDEDRKLGREKTERRGPRETTKEKRN